jgi:putative spermidine/putrescine transport system permease protein
MFRGRRGDRQYGAYSPLLLAALLTPMLALLTTTFYVPLGNVVASSFGGAGGFANEYKTVVSNPVFWVVLRRTFVTAALVTGICLLAAYPVAEMIRNAPPRARTLLLALVIVPLWSGVIPRTYAWFGIFRQDGVYAELTSWLSGDRSGLLFTTTAVLIGMVHVMLPLMVLPVYAAVLRYDDNLSKASLSLGATPLRTLRQVKLPVLGPQLAAASVAVFVLSLGFFITPAVLGGPRASMISNLVYQQIFDRVDFPRGNALGMVLLVTTLGILAVAAALARVFRRYAAR